MWSVSRVGGIPEVLPKDLIYMAEPSASAIISALNTVIEKIKLGKTPTKHEMHGRIAPLYTWPKVKRTLKQTQRLLGQSTAEPVTMKLFRSRTGQSESTTLLCNKLRLTWRVECGSCTCVDQLLVYLFWQRFVCCRQTVQQRSIVSGSIFIVYVLLDHLLCRLLAWLHPLRRRRHYVFKRFSRNSPVGDGHPCDMHWSLLMHLRIFLRFILQSVGNASPLLICSFDSSNNVEIFVVFALSGKKIVIFYKSFCCKKLAAEAANRKTYNFKRWSFICIWDCYVLHEQNCTTINTVRRCLQTEAIKE